MADTILTVEQIKRLTSPIFKKYGIKIAWLFGAYARGEATATSNIDIRLERGRVMGLEYVRFYREIKNTLGKKCDIYTTKQIFPSMLKNIQQDEILLYER